MFPKREKVSNEWMFVSEINFFKQPLLSKDNKQKEETEMDDHVFAVLNNPEKTLENIKQVCEEITRHSQSIVEMSDPMYWYPFPQPAFEKVHFKKLIKTTFPDLWKQFQYVLDDLDVLYSNRNIDSEIIRACHNTIMKFRNDIDYYKKLIEAREYKEINSEYGEMNPNTLKEMLPPFIAEIEYDFSLMSDEERNNDLNIRPGRIYFYPLNGALEYAALGTDNRTVHRGLISEDQLEIKISGDLNKEKDVLVRKCEIALNDILRIMTNRKQIPLIGKRKMLVGYEPPVVLALRR